MGSIIVGKVYADWCGHCQELAPKWEALKDSMSSSQVTFVEYEEPETDENGFFTSDQGYRIKSTGLPTIFKIHSSREPEYYTGSREPEHIKQWVLSSPKKSFRNTKKKIKKKKNKKNKRKTQQRGIPLSK